MEKKINLEEILDDIMIGSGWSLSDSLIKEVIIPAMKEACIQTNNLDVENATLLEDGVNIGCWRYIVSEGNHYNETEIDIDKNSILKTLDQIN